MTTINNWRVEIPPEPGTRIIGETASNTSGSFTIQKALDCHRIYGSMYFDNPAGSTVIDMTATLTWYQFTDFTFGPCSGVLTTTANRLICPTAGKYLVMVGGTYKAELATTLQLGLFSSASVYNAGLKIIQPLVAGELGDSYFFAGVVDLPANGYLNVRMRKAVAGNCEIFHRVLTLSCRYLGD